jgi:hydrogenase nickel incorporation protein HypA/HybF
MHELSLAQSIVGVVEQHVARSDRVAVKEVTLRIGEMSGVVPDSLEFCFTAITSCTDLQNARLRIQTIPFTIRCASCREVATSPAGLAVCPHCGLTVTEAIGGTELQVVEITLSDPTEAICVS